MLKLSTDIEELQKLLNNIGGTLKKGVLKKEVKGEVRVFIENLTFPPEIIVLFNNTVKRILFAIE